MSSGHDVGLKSYVGIAPTTSIFTAHPSGPTSTRPLPHSDARLVTPYLCLSNEDTTTQSIEERGGAANKSNVTPSRRYPHTILPPDLQIDTRLTYRTIHYQLSRAPALPPVQPSQQLAATPDPRLPAKARFADTFHAYGLPTPPGSAVLFSQEDIHTEVNKMVDPRNAGAGQRPNMGPPETPSRAMQESPNMFPSLQFSPDMFSTQGMGTMTAPVYPQQRLFWDQFSQNTPGHLQQPHQQMPTQQPQYAISYQDFSNAFPSRPSAMNEFDLLPSQDQGYQLPDQSRSAGAGYLGNPSLPAPFHTSPRAPVQGHDNPTMFLSSPARRFGGSEAPTRTMPKRAVREVPAYHHQIQESRREMEIEQERRRSKVKKKNDDELIMGSVKRALSPNKQLRPTLTRSQTHSGVSPQRMRPRQTSRGSFNDSASVTSATSGNSSRSSRPGRLSPLKQTTLAGSSVTKPFQKTRANVVLAIDENGVAKTVLEELAESDEDLDARGKSPSVGSSTDEEDFHIIQSQPGSFCFNDDDDDTSSRAKVKRPATLQMGRKRPGTDNIGQRDRASSHSYASADSESKRYQQDTVRQPKRAALHIDTVNTARHYASGDAQRALRAIIKDRSRSASSQGDHSSSRQSDSSVQFHSSPPIQQSKFGGYSRSPTTITEPDLATPGSDHDGFATAETIRCVCDSTLPDILPMVQCQSCSKLLHSKCVGVDILRLTGMFVCVYCEQTPMRPAAQRLSARPSQRMTGQNASPLAHKSAKPRRTR